MWSTAILSALLGAGVALVTSEPGRRWHEPMAPQHGTPGCDTVAWCRSRPRTNEQADQPPRSGSACRVRAGVHRDVEMACQGGMADPCPSTHVHGLMFLSQDLTECELISADDSLGARFSSISYCNSSQVAACAEAKNSFLDPSSEASALSSSTQEIGGVLVRLLLESTANHLEVKPGRAMLPLVAVEGAEHPPGQERQARPSFVNEGSLARKRDAVPAVGQALSTPAMASLTTVSEKGPVSKPSGSGTKQLTGMAAALATVLLIFVVWL